jgi:Zn-dependent protease
MNLELALLYFVALVTSIIIHEIAHGYVAAAFGDDTARNAGRLSLNPIRHVDPFGSILVPAMGALAGLPVVGWAKPVPISAHRLRHPRRDMLLVSFAGPASNFVLCIAFAIATRFLLGNGGLIPNAFGAGGSFIVNLCYTFAFVNLLLGVFNLLPIPPLDGSAIFELFMPETWKPHWYRLRPYGILVIFGIVFFIPGLLNAVLSPFANALHGFVVG